MNRLLCAAIAALTLLTVATPADACHRCGIFGRGCRFSSYVSHVAYQAPYVAPASVQNFVFSNSFPVPSIAQSNSVYGYSLAAAPYAFDSTAYMDRASRFQELALETAQAGINGFSANAAQALAVTDANDRRTKNAVVALAAIQANQQQPAIVGSASGVGSQSITTFTVRNGVLTVGNGQPGGVQDFSANVLESCARCHDGQGTHGEPREVVLDGSRVVDWPTYERCFVSVQTGKMPKLAPGQAPISDAQRFAILKALPRLMLANQAQQPEQPLPPPPVPNPNAPPNF